MTVRLFTDGGDGASSRATPVSSCSQFSRPRQFAAECLVVEFDGQPVRPGPVKLTLDDTDNFHMEMSFPVARPARLRVRAALFEHLPPDHFHFLSVHEADGRSLATKLLQPSDATLELLPGAAATKARPASAPSPTS